VTEEELSQMLDKNFPDLRQISNRLQECIGDIDDISPHCCILLGNTGAGKSTTVNALVQG